MRIGIDDVVVPGRILEDRVAEGVCLPGVDQGHVRVEGQLQQVLLAVDDLLGDVFDFDKNETMAIIETIREVTGGEKEKTWFDSFKKFLG